MRKNERRTDSIRLQSPPEVLQRFAECMEQGNLQRAYQILQESGSTSDFPVLMGTGSHRVVQQAYREVPSRWREICNTGTIPDFREKEIIRLSEADDLEEIKELSEIPDSKLSETKEKTKLAVFARRFSISWQTVVNDDTDTIRKQPQRFGRSAGRLLNRLVFPGILEGNPTMGDGTPLFHADHGNLGNAELAETSLQDAFTALRKQKDEKGNPLDIIVNKPKLVVPTDLVWVAEKLVNPIAVVQNGGASTPITSTQGKAVVVEAPWLTDPNDWYLIIDPRDGDTIQLDFLRMIGENPQLFMKADQWQFVGGGQAGIDQFDHEYMVRHVAQAKAVEWRNMYKSSPNG